MPFSTYCDPNNAPDRGQLIVVNKTLDRTFNNVSILLRNTIFALQRIGRWCGFSPGVNYSFLFIPKFLLGRDFFFT